LIIIKLIVNDSRHVVKGTLLLKEANFDEHTGTSVEHNSATGIDLGRSITVDIFFPAAYGWGHKVSYIYNSKYHFLRHYHLREYPGAISSFL